MLLSFSRRLAGAVAFSAWATLAFAAQNQTSPPSNNWPTTVDGAVQDILSNMSDDVKMQIRISRKDHLIELHFRLMTGIRNPPAMINSCYPPVATPVVPKTLQSK